MKKNNDKELYKIYISLLMMVVMIFPIFLSTAVQAEIVAPENPIQVITAFNVSDEDLKSRNIALGTKTEHLSLPDSVLVDLEESDEMPERGVEVPLTWTSQPQYDKDTPGEYTFTASAGEEYMLADGLAAPSIKVVVEKEADNQESLIRQAQPLSNAEPYQISSAGSALDQTKYTTLKAAFDAINLDTAAQYTISLSSNDDMTGDGAAELTRENVKISINGNGHTILQGDHDSHISSIGIKNIDLEIDNIKLTALDKSLGGIAIPEGKVTIKNSTLLNMMSKLGTINANFENSSFQNMTGPIVSPGTYGIFKNVENTFTNCIFKDIYDISGDNFMFFNTSGDILFKNCTLENVGDIRHDRSYPMTIEDCTFKNTGRIFTWNNCTLNLKGTVLLDGTAIEMRNNAILNAEAGSDITIKNTTTSAIFGGNLSNINFSGANVKFENNGRNIRSRKPTSEEIAQYPNISAVRTSIVEKYYNYLHPLNNKDIAFTGGIDFPSYIPTYDPNKGSGTRYEDRDTREPDYKNVFYGTGAGYIVLDNTSDTHLKYSRVGYEFVSWNTKSDGTGHSYTAYDVATIDADNNTFYALWKAHQYTIKFDGNTADGGSTDDQTMTYDTAANLTANGYTKTGYTFTGWNTQPDGGGTAYSNGQNVKNLTTVDGDTITLYAQWRANNYIIKYDGNAADSGSMSDQPMAFDVAANLTNNAYTRTGYTFTGWNTHADGSGTSYTNGESVKNLTNVEAGTVTLYAQWKPHQYTVKFDGNTADGGSTANQAMTYDTAVNLTTNGYTKTGYTFTGWNTQSDGGGTAYTDGQNVRNLTPEEGGTVTLFAQWQANNYTIQFDGNTADGGDTANQVMTYDQATNLTANGYTKTGYTFTGWNTQSDGGGTAYTDGQNVTNLTSVEGETVTLFAQWRANSYTIQFDGNTADGGSTSDQVMTYDQAASLTVNGYTKTGYTFTGWNTQSDGGGTAYTDGQTVSNLTSEKEGSVTLYAQWRANNYTIQFNGNTADGGNTPEQSMTYDQAADLTANGYTKTGYTFAGWNTQSDGGGTTYTDGQNVTNLTSVEGETVTLFAQWRANSYTIQFDGNTADGGSTSDQVMTYDQAANLTANGYTKTGYTFTGWNTQSDGGGTAYTDGQTVSNLTSEKEGSVTLYAQWRANNYTIQFNGNTADGGNTPEQSMTYDQAADLTANGYTKTGYTFAGWNTQSDGGGTTYTDGQNVTNLTSVDGETVTLFAQWRANSYTIQFDGNTADGGSTSDQVMTYDQTADLTANGYTKTGYTFTEWNTQPDGGGTTYTDGQNVSNLTSKEGDKVTLYAQWRANSYTIQFDGNTADGGNTPDQGMIYDQAADLTANGYTKTGYTFTGWNTQPDGGGTSYTDGQNISNLTSVEGDTVTLYAQWRANSYTIQFDGNTADGGDTPDQGMTYDQAVDLTANGYTKTGYTFTGWNTQPDGGGTTYADGETVSNLTPEEGGTVTLYAQWRANSYTIQFDGNTADGGNTPDQGMIYDQAADLTANGYTKTGYTFTGWNSQPDGGGTSYTDGQNISNLTSVEGETVTLFAQWRANSYTIQFDGNTADGGDTPDQGMTYDQAASLTVNGYTKTGYTFTGWNTQYDGGGTAYTDSETVSNLASEEGGTVILFAQWRANHYTIIFDGNTADGGSTSDQPMIYDQAADLTANGYTKTGYTFAGWNTQDDGGGTSYTDGQNVSNLTSVEGETVTLFAQWRANHYTIRFDGNTADGGSTADQPMIYDAAVNLTANGYTKTGYAFAGWNTQPDGGGTAYGNEQSVVNLTPDEGSIITLFAQWHANNYIVAFDGNTADSGSMSDQPMAFDIAVNLTANAYTKNGYTFSGWNTQRGGEGTEYTDGQTVVNLTAVEGETVTLYAQWRANYYSIKFDGNTADGGSTTDQPMTYDQAASLTINGYTKTGYAFTGWNTQPDGGGTAYTDGQNVSNLTSVDGETVTLYAQWRANHYTIKFDGNTADGGSTTDQPMTYDQAASLTANGYTKTGYTFAGWNTQYDGGGTAYTDGQTVSNLASEEGGMVTLFAQWRANHYTIRFDGNTADGGSTLDQPMTYDQAASLTTNGYTKTGYNFMDWNTQPNGGGTAYTDGETVSNLTSAEGETVTLYAQWRANNYTIRFDGNTADGGSTLDQPMTYDQAASLTINGYTKTGYTFTSWNTQADGGGTTYTDGQNVSNLTPEEGGTVTLFAQWRANNYTIQFDGNTADGGSTPDQPMTYDQAASLTINGYTKTGYTFTGWNTQADGGGTAYTDGEAVSNLTSENEGTFILYAQWRANSYTLKFDGNTAAGGSTPDQIMTYDQTAELTANGYTKTGFAFSGWNTQADGQGTGYTERESVKNLTTVDDDTVLLYAQWRLRIPGITVNQNVSAHGDTINVTGTDFEPNAEITFTVHSTPREVGRVHADSNGEALFTFQMPFDIEAGDHTLLADNGIHSAQTPVKVTASAHADSNAADNSGHTGGNSAGTGIQGSTYIPIIMILLLCGVLVVVLLKRKHSKR